MKTQIFFVLVVACFVYVAADPQFFCGRKLANALAVMCPYQDYQGTSKRSGNTLEDYEGFGLSWLLNQASKAEALTTKAKRGGIVSECCEKPCSIDELLTYC
ncbi:bombyxin A-3 homolog [Ostrinia nubilalis]|uniref:bombyxin A-3 homolog n=1 Tax=Ostrinia nubilalis TaxID=29057 RepID=UPI0030822F4C